MANSYFKFKQFKIHQHKCAMKVCTDACLFGALVAELHLEKKLVLDIGTGTGLLSLMLAQKNDNMQIDAVEIEAAAAEQALENIAASPWPNRISVHHSDILKFEPGKHYDLIISNPPFFEEDLQSPDQARNKAKHGTTLNLAQLVTFTGAHLAKHGTLAVLLPYPRMQHFIDVAAAGGLFLNRQVLVKQTLKHKFFRAILFFGRKTGEPQCSELIIKELDQNYTSAFLKLLKDYYLFI